MHYSVIMCVILLMYCTPFVYWRFLIQFSSCVQCGISPLALERPLGTVICVFPYSLCSGILLGYSGIFCLYQVGSWVVTGLFSAVLIHCLWLRRGIPLAVAALSVDGG